MTKVHFMAAVGNDSTYKSYKRVCKEIKSMMLLGLTIDNKLKFDIHINEICSGQCENQKFKKNQKSLK